MKIKTILFCAAVMNFHYSATSQITETKIIPEDIISGFG